MHRPRIFISAVTRDMGEARQLVANTLLQLGYEPDWMDVFETEHGDIREMLRRRIRRCKGVVHLVGHCYGLEPRTRDPNFGRVSYTQYEALYAAQIGKPVWRLLAADNFRAEHDETTREPEELRILQQAYRKKLQDDSAQLFTVVSSGDSLKLAVRNMQSEMSRLRRRSQLWAGTISLIGMCTLTAVLWLVSGQSSVKRAVGGAKAAGEAAAAAANAARDMAVEGRTAAEEARVASTKAGEEASEAREAAVDAGSVAAAARSAAEAGRRKVEALLSQTEIDNARRSVEDAIKAADRSLRGQVRAMEQLLVSGYKYTGARLDGLSLEGGLLMGGDFSHASLRDADLSDANLSGGSLVEADLAFASLPQAVLRAVEAPRAHFEYIVGTEALFADAKLRQSTFFCSDLTRADFRNADLHSTCFAYCDLTGARFDGADLSGSTFYGSLLDGATFAGSTVVNVDMTGAIASEPLALTRDQRDGLRRTRGLYFLEIKIWGDLDASGSRTQDYTEAFNSGFADFNNIRLSVSSTLPFRDKLEIASDRDACVGCFGSYAEGYGDIRCLEQFGRTFWDTPGRASRIVGWLKRHATKLKESHARGRPVEGSNAQREAWLAHIEKAVARTRPVDPAAPLFASDDTLLVIMLAAGAVDADKINWATAFRSRVAIDAETYTRPDSYSSLFHPTAYNTMIEKTEFDRSVYNSLHKTYEDAYRKWTQDRARDVKLPIEMTFLYYVSSVDIARLRPANDQGGVLLFEPLQSHTTSAPLALIYDEWDKRNDVIWPRQSVVNCAIRLPHPRSAWQAILPTFPAKTLEHIDIRLTCRVEGVSFDQNGVMILAGTPLRLSYHDASGHLQWSVPIAPKIDNGP